VPCETARGGCFVAKGRGWGSLVRSRSLARPGWAGWTAVMRCMDDELEVGAVS
jgi:hypothetical protein